MHTQTFLICKLRWLLSLRSMTGQCINGNLFYRYVNPLIQTLGGGNFWMVNLIRCETKIGEEKNRCRVELKYYSCRSMLNFNHIDVISEKKTEQQISSSAHFK